MLANHWYPLVFSRALKRRPLPLTRGGIDLVLFRDDQGHAHCLRDRCPHRGVPLSLGSVRAGRLVCGYHGFEFTGEGSCVHMPCEGRGARIPAGMTTPSYPVREANDMLWLFWGAPDRAESTPIPRLETAERFGGVWADTTLEWPLGYASSLENNFDVHHFNYVHASQAWLTRPPSRISEVDVELRTDGVDYTATLEAEPGEPQRMGRFRVEYRAPSLQALHLGENSLATVYDSPIDATRTYRMLRMSQRNIELPVVGRLLTQLFVLVAGKYAQLYEDLPFARHVAPPGEDRPIRADAGIQAFRKFRRRAIRDAAEDRDLPEHVRAALGWEPTLVDPQAAAQ